MKKPTPGYAIELMDYADNLYLSTAKASQDRWAVELIQKKPELRDMIKERVKRRIKEIFASDNVYKSFRVLLFNTIEVSVIYDVLLEEKYNKRSDIICDSINTWAGSLRQDDMLFKGFIAAKSFELFPDMEWDSAKVTFESAAAEIQLVYYRSFQMQMFEAVSGGNKKDWWDLFRDEYDKFIRQYYDAVVMYGRDKGYPHPMVASMANDHIMKIELELEDTAVKP